MSELLQNIQEASDRVLKLQTDQELAPESIYPLELDRSIAQLVNTLQTAVLQEILALLPAPLFIAKLQELFTFPPDYDYVSNIDLLCEVISFSAAVYAVMNEQKNPEATHIDEVMKGLGTLPKQVRETILRRTRNSQFATQILRWVK